MSLMSNFIFGPVYYFPPTPEDQYLKDVPRDTSQSTWWVFFQCEEKKFYFIEEVEENKAHQFLLDEFGVTYDSSKFASRSYSNFHEACGDWGFSEEQFSKSRIPILFMRTKDRKVTRSYQDGLFCVRCGVFFEFAIANEPHGRLRCWSCRKGM